MGRISDGRERDGLLDSLHVCGHDGHHSEHEQEIPRHQLHGDCVRLRVSVRKGESEREREGIEVEGSLKCPRRSGQGTSRLADKSGRSQLLVRCL
jgi:hypothetical protein